MSKASRILVVDDDDFQLKLISSQLIKSGFLDVATFNGGADALIQLDAIQQAGESLGAG